MASQFVGDLFSLAGKTAIITGGTGGLGSAMTLALAKAGAQIVSIEIPEDPSSAALTKLVSEAGRHIVSFQCDVIDAKSLRACYAAIWKAGYTPDILLNCAGVMRRNKCEDVTEEDLDFVFGVNLKAVYISAQEFGRKLIELNRPGKIINIASVTSFLANFNTSVYAASKGGVLQMTKAFSNEWASKNIQVNCIAPGFMRTTMTDGYAADPSYTEYLMSRVPANRWGLPADLAGAVIFLACPASTFITGVCLPVDGGYLAK